MKVLQVIHGYTMRHKAGSEVYTQALCHGLAGRHEVHVFTSVGDPFPPDFGMHHESDPGYPKVTLHVVNNPRNRDRSISQSARTDRDAPSLHNRPWYLLPRPRPWA